MHACLGLWNFVWIFVKFQMLFSLVPWHACRSISETSYYDQNSHLHNLIPFWSETEKTLDTQNFSFAKANDIYLLSKNCFCNSRPNMLYIIYFKFCCPNMLYIIYFKFRCSHDFVSGDLTSLLNLTSQNAYNRSATSITHKILTLDARSWYGRSQSPILNRAVLGSDTKCNSLTQSAIYYSFWTLPPSRHDAPKGEQQVNDQHCS